VQKPARVAAEACVRRATTPRSTPRSSSGRTSRGPLTYPIVSSGVPGSAHEATRAGTSNSRGRRPDSRSSRTLSTRVVALKRTDPRGRTFTISGGSRISTSTGPRRGPSTSKYKRVRERGRTASKPSATLSEKLRAGGPAWRAGTRRTGRRAARRSASTSMPREWSSAYTVSPARSVGANSAPHTIPRGGT